MTKHFLKATLLLLTFFASMQSIAIENPLKLQVRFNLPPEIETVHGAANYFISPHQYQVQYASSAPAIAIEIGQQPLPVNRPEGGLLDIESALLSLLNDDQVLIIDTKNKLISFGMK